MEKAKHIAFVKENPFEFAISRHGFSEEEVAFIEKHGHWLHALVEGKLAPCTPAQKAFIEEMKSRKPIEDCLPQVQLWKRYLRGVIERDKGHIMKAPPPTTADDPFGSREDFKAMRKGQFSTISKTHRQ